MGKNVSGKFREVEEDLKKMNLFFISRCCRRVPLEWEQNTLHFMKILEQESNLIMFDIVQLKMIDLLVLKQFFLCYSILSSIFFLCGTLKTFFQVHMEYRRNGISLLLRVIGLEKIIRNQIG